MNVKRVLVISVLLASSLFAQQPPRTMTKMVVQLQSEDAPSGSFAAKPKTVFRSGAQYCRVEEAADPEHGIHGLMIINEPDAWMVNLDGMTARHMTDTGPTLNCRLPIFAGWLSDVSEDQGKQIAQLEFGREIEFFKSGGGKPGPGPELQGQQTTAYLLEFGDVSLALFTYGKPERPLAVVWKRGEKHDILWYSGYGEVDFDASLFAKPKNVKIEEAQ